MTSWTETRPAPLPSTTSQSLLKFMFIELVMLSKHSIHFHPLLLLHSIFPSFRVFSSELTFCIRWQSIGASAAVSILPMNFYA